MHLLQLYNNVNEMVPSAAVNARKKDNDLLFL
jgi:hypothetical protein